MVVVGEKLQCADIFKVVSGVENRLGRKINPTLVTPADLTKQREQDSVYSRVLNQAKIFVIGAADDLAESRKARKGRKAQG
jgi:hypothetical protein